MKMIVGGKNKKTMESIARKATKKGGEVLAAVAYSTAKSDKLLFNLCKKRNVKLTYYGRFDSAGSSVHSTIMQKFYNGDYGKNSKCFLVENHHAKVIWWKKVGVYIGSANFTDPAWKSNIEVGCYFEESQITDDMRSQLENLFSTLESNNFPINKMRIAEMEEREERLKAFREKSKRQKATIPLKAPRVTTLMAKRKEDFVVEWNKTQEIFDGIAKHFEGGINCKNRPKWVDSEPPSRVHADQFLHAIHDKSQKDNGKNGFDLMLERNKGRREEFLHKSLAEWRAFPKPPGAEKDIMEIDFPCIHDNLQEGKIINMDEGKFIKVYGSVHAVKDYCKKTAKIIDEFAGEIYRSHNAYQQNARETLNYLLHGGDVDDLPERLWDCVHDRRYRIKHLGIGALGEISGWVHCHRFSPRNGRTSRALRTFGYPVVVHS